MNWKAVGLTLTLIGLVTAAACWAWSGSIHQERHDCRIGNLFGGAAAECPSKTPAIIGASIGGVITVLGVALLVGAAAARRKPAS